MNIGILLPGFSSDENDWAIPVQLNLVRTMAAHDDVRVLALRYPHRRDSYRVYGATVDSLGVGQVRGLGRLTLWWEALRTLRRLHHEKPFDVFHAMWADETGLIAAWAGRWLGVPVVVSIAGGELARLDDINYGLQRGAFSRWTVRQALEGADRVVVACSYIQRLITEPGLKIEADKIRTIALGVDTEVFQKATEANSRQKNHLIHVASLVSVKDHATLLRAFVRLKTPATLDILGTGPQHITLQSLAGQLGISERVNFIGSVGHLDLPGHYQKAALNILSSRHEGLGMVTLEAAACGIPTVSTAVGLLPDHPSLGVSVPIGDDETLAAVIETLLADDQRRTSLAQSANETVKKQFTIQDTVEQFRRLYAELIETTSA